MNFCILIEEKERVTVETVSRFLTGLNQRGFLNDLKPIDGLYLSSIDDDEEKSLHPESVAAAIEHIETFGVKDISIFFNYKKSSNFGEKLGEPGRFADLMRALNRSAKAVARACDPDFVADFCYGIIFSSRKYQTDCDEIDACQLEFGGETSSVDDVEKCSEIMSDVMRRDAPHFSELLELMSNCFGRTRVELTYDFA